MKNQTLDLIAYFLGYWNFAQSMVVINKMIGQMKWMLLMNEISRDFVISVISLLV